MSVISVPEEYRKRTTIASNLFYDKLDVQEDKVVGYLNGRQTMTWYFRNYTGIDLVKANMNSQFAQVVFLTGFNSRNRFVGVDLGAVQNRNAMNDTNRILFCSGMFSFDNTNNFADRVARDIRQAYEAYQEKLEKGQGMQTTVVNTAPGVTINPNASTESLIERVKIFLEDEEWAKADAYCESLLDREPRNAEIYFLKFLATHHKKSISELDDKSFSSYLNDRNYKKAKQYAEGELKEALSSYESGAEKRNLISQVESLSGKADLTSKFEALDLINNHIEIQELEGKREALAEDIKNTAESKINSATAETVRKIEALCDSEIGKAPELFEGFDYKKISEERILALEKKETEEKEERRIKAEELRKKEEERTVEIEKQRKKKKTIAVIAVVVLIGVIVAVTLYLMQQQKKREANVTGLIESIGTVTLESEEAIQTAEKAYEALSEKEKLAVTNYDTLKEARTKYDALAEQAERDAEIARKQAEEEAKKKEEEEARQKVIEARQNAYKACKDNIISTGTKREDALFSGYEYVMPTEPGKTYDMRASIGAKEDSDDLWILFEYTGTEESMKEFNWAIDLNGETGTYNINVPVTIETNVILSKVKGSFEIASYDEKGPFNADEVIADSGTDAWNEQIKTNMTSYAIHVVPSSINMLEYWIRNNGLGYSLEDLGFGVDDTKQTSSGPSSGNSTSKKTGIRTCPNCNGTKWVKTYETNDPLEEPTIIECPMCHGTGKVTD